MDPIAMLRDPYLWAAVSFVLFLVLFGGTIWTTLTKMLDARGAAVQAELAEAARLRTEAEAMLRQAEADRAAALAEAEKLLAHARAEATRLTAAAEVEAEAAAKRRERMAMDRIAAAEAGAVTEVRNAATDIAIAAARSVIAQSLNPEADAALIDRAVADLPRALRAA
jgi:F-type H+-transporting ATPase subunit b